MPRAYNRSLPLIGERERRTVVRCAGRYPNELIGADYPRPLFSQVKELLEKAKVFGCFKLTQHRRTLQREKKRPGRTSRYGESLQGVRMSWWLVVGG